MRHLLKRAALCAAIALMPFAARAEYPEQPVRYILHVSPGGATDVMARRLAVELEKQLGQPFVVENKPGGRGAAQLAEITKAAPDGYTIASVTSTHIGALNQTLKQYKIDSFDWIARLANEPYLVVVPGSSDIKTMKDLVAKAKAAPGSIRMAGFVRGSGGHFAWELMAKSADLDSKSVRWVPYDSVGDAVTATLGEHADAAIAYVDLVKNYVAAGQMRVIGIMADQRVPQLPDVPTLKEQGFAADTSWQQMRGIIGPKGMPDDIKAELADAVQKSLQAPEMQEYFKESSLQNAFLGPKEFPAEAQHEDEVTKAMMRDLGIAQ
ncbi:Bug family tripartite tricarboxylate transporter substrate binding protein [Mangrovicella endophytica]|uniref:Bug family tripartite tricarboxylate transporter substrate binding protein n=1 Tax=Mangrovicella endophytica TaxID=2066697 RepID=UPI000C9E9D92|nr:tripartite tricarboxylate transporter substrate binding protein [Mangrovicella endophytica]